MLIRIAVISAVVLGVPLAHSGTMTYRQGINGYTGTVDTHIRRDQPTNGFASSTFVHVDNDSPIAHGLLRFDDIFGEGPGQVPPWAELFSARLIFHTTSDSDPVWFHRMLVPWNETNTWNDLSTRGPGLQADGIEMAAIPDFTFTASTPVPRVDSFDVTATVYDWLVGNSPNYGWGITNEISNGWMFSSSENSTNANRPVLEITFHAGPQPIEILTHPTNVTAIEGDSVTFSVGTRGAFPEYQWFKGAIPLATGTNSTHTIPVVRQSDAGTYHVVVRNEWQQPILSSNAVLTVNHAGPPSVTCVYGTNDFLTLFVVFSQIVINGNDWVNYAIVPSSGGEQLTVASAVYPGGATEGSIVVLTLDPSTPLEPLLSYTLGVGAVFNRFGDSIDPDEVTRVTLYLEPIFTISPSQIWTFNDSGIDLGDSWKNPTYDDSSWNSGPALLGVETAILPEPLRTTVSFTNSAGARIRTHYFRKHFFQFGATGENVLRFRLIVDDAAAIYLNGAEIFRIRLPGGPLDYTTQGAGAAVGDAVYEGPFTVCVTNLINGDNVLAAEVHQTGDNSSDIVFGLELWGLSPDPPPHCLARSPTNQTVNAGDSVTFSVLYTCPYRDAQWFRGGAAIPGATNLTYTIGFVLPDHAGDYYVRVDSNWSSLARLTVLSCCAPEVIAVYATNETIILQFNKETIYGLDLANFFVSAADDSHDLWLASAAYTSGTNYGTVLLLRINPFTRMQPDTPYKIYFEGIGDRFGNVITPQTWSIARFPSSVIRLNASQQWRYETSGTDLSNTWYRFDYDDTAWPVGQALFDARRPPRTHVSGELVRTMTTLSNATATAQIPTHYFRTRFNYAGPVSNIICIRPFVDDGAVYYLNGREVLRVGMPQFGAISHGTMATTNIGNATFEGPYYVAVTNLVSGENVLAVEVHQQSIVSSDLTFGTEFGLLLTVPPRLRITLSTEGTDITLNWSGSAVLEQTSSLSPTGWAEVEGAVSGHTMPLSGSKFFRLREP